jgi:hypothetical protein
VYVLRLPGRRGTQCERASPTAFLDHFNLPADPSICFLEWVFLGNDFRSDTSTAIVVCVFRLWCMLAISVMG